MGELDEQAADAFRRQSARRSESHRVDRAGWTAEQWCDDAIRLMNEPDGAVTSLVNGHATHLIAERRTLKAQVERLRTLVAALEERLHIAETDADLLAETVTQTILRPALAATHVALASHDAAKQART